MHCRTTQNELPDSARYLAYSPAQPLHVFAVNDDGHGAVIHEFDRHLRPKAARLYLNPRVSYLGREHLDQRFSSFASSGSREIGPPSPTRVSQKSELAYDERLARDIEQRQVEPTGIV